MGEGVPANHGLVRLHHVAGRETIRPGPVFSKAMRWQAVNVPYLDQHRDLPASVAGRSLPIPLIAHSTCGRRPARRAYELATGEAPDRRQRTDSLTSFKRSGRSGGGPRRTSCTGGRGTLTVSGMLTTVAPSSDRDRTDPRPEFDITAGRNPSARIRHPHSRTGLATAARLLQHRPLVFRIRC